jgi:ABC-type polysaccharide/polyol phosphate transport system ATPase subunit
MSDPSISASGLSVVYRLPHHKGKGITSFKEFVIQAARRRVNYTSLWALRNASFTVSPGEILGVIGANGAGKTTLLKLIAGIRPPSEGRIIVRGRVAPVIELGAGLNDDLTTHENIILLGALLGRDPRRMRKRVPAIAAWAGLESFLDVPVRTFSAGMVARLGFAVATDTQPDVLVIDEVLSVGDAGFAIRSEERMSNLMSAGTAVVIASHDLDFIRERTTRTLWLEAGRMRRLGPSCEVVGEYLERLNRGACRGDELSTAPCWG